METPVSPRRTLVSRDERLLTLGGRVRQVRLDRGMSQEALADKVGVGKLTILRIEAGDTDPHLSTFVKICAALDVTADTLVYGAR